MTRLHRLLFAALVLVVASGTYVFAGGLPSPTGTGFPHVTGGAPDPTARAVNVASSDITGTLAHGHGGTDVTSTGTDGGFLRSDGTNWSPQHISDNDISGLSPAFNIPTANAFTAESFGFSVGFTPGFGRVSDPFSSDADKYASASTYNNPEISLSGTQNYRTYYLPLTNTGFPPSAVGPVWRIINGTTSPVQIKGALADGGPSGTGGWCPKGAYCLARDNGQNVFIDRIADGTSAQLDQYDGGGVEETLKTNGICTPFGTTKTCSTELAGITGDHTTWVTIGQFFPAASTGGNIGINFGALDLGQDAGGVSGVANCTLVFEYAVTSNGVVTLISQLGAQLSSVQIPLACVAPTVGTGLDGGSDSGTPSSATSFSFQVVNSSGLVQLQVQGPDTHLWKWGTPIQHQRLP